MLFEKTLNQSLPLLRKKLDKLRSQHALAREQVRIEKQALVTGKRREQDVLDAQKLVQSVAEGIQNQAHQRIASVVTRCLKAVFGSEGYNFVIRFHQKRGRTEAELLFERNGLEIDPATSSGGGVLDVASMALRLAALMLSLPKGRRTLCLDEPLKHLSSNYRPIAAELLQMLASELKVQLIIISHTPEFMEIGKEVSVG